MSEDRPPGPLDFTAEEQERRWAHRRDPDLDLREPERPPPASKGRYTWFLGVAGLVLIIYVMVNSLSSEGPGSQGVAPGKPMPVFAAPLALSRLEGDVNVARKANQDEAGERPACQVRGPDVLNACELWRKPVALAFFAEPSSESIRQIDTLQALAAQFPEISVAAIALRGDRDDVRKLIRKRGWTIPIGYDADGILANLYGAAAVPHVTYARAGGKVVETTIGEADRAEVTALLRRLR